MMLGANADDDEGFFLSSFLGATFGLLVTGATTAGIDELPPGVPLVDQVRPTVARLPAADPDGAPVTVWGVGGRWP